MRVSLIERELALNCTAFTSQSELIQPINKSDPHNYRRERARCGFWSRAASPAGLISQGRQQVHALPTIAPATQFIWAVMLVRPLFFVAVIIRQNGKILPPPGDLSKEPKANGWNERRTFVRALTSRGWGRIKFSESATVVRLGILRILL